MDQTTTNRGSYKKQSMAQQFVHSCLGKVIILIAACILLFIIALFTVPSDNQMKWQMEDNIRECLQDNDSIHGDKIDEAFSNVRRIFTHADTTVNDKERLETFHRLNKLEYYRHSFFSTAHVRNNIYPQGIREGIGIFGIVIPTINYDDFLMSEGPVRGKYNERLIKDMYVPDDYLGDNPHLKPYHYKGNPDD